MLPAHQLDLLIDYMGGFPGALAILLEVLHNTKDVGKPFTFEAVLRAVVSELHVVYPSISIHLPAMIEAFLAVIRRDDVTSLTKFGETCDIVTMDASFDEAFSCGLLRLNVDERLECPYVLYLLLDSLPNRWDEQENHAPRELRGDWKPWVTWNEFYSTFRVLKSLAWADRKGHMGWWQLHRGAYMTYSCQQWVKETRRSIALGTTTTQNIAESSLASDRVHQSPCGDLFVCMEVMNQGFFYEMHRRDTTCGMTKNLTKPALQRIQHSGLGPDGLLVLFTLKDASLVMNELVDCAVVDPSCMPEYFSAFLARASFLLKNPSRTLEDLELAQSTDADENHRARYSPAALERCQPTRAVRKTSVMKPGTKKRRLTRP